jgi:hypothetical protein
VAPNMVPAKVPTITRRSTRHQGMGWPDVCSVRPRTPPLCQRRPRPSPVRLVPRFAWLRHESPAITPDSEWLGIRLIRMVRASRNCPPVDPISAISAGFVTPGTPRRDFDQGQSPSQSRERPARVESSFDDGRSRAVELSGAFGYCGAPVRMAVGWRQRRAHRCFAGRWRPIAASAARRSGRSSAMIQYPAAASGNAAQTPAK